METTDYCSYELSKALKACGFDEPCDRYYARKSIIGDKFKLTDVYSCIRHQNSKYSTASAPTLWQAQKWLREKKKLHILVDFDLDGDWYYKVLPIVGCCIAEGYRGYLIYEQALSDGISDALQLLDNEKE
jgi:hypothetical protein